MYIYIHIFVYIYIYIYIYIYVTYIIWILGNLSCGLWTKYLTCTVLCWHCASINSHIGLEMFNIVPPPIYARVTHSLK